MKSYPQLTSPEEIPLRFTEGWNERDADFVNVVGIWWRNREDIRKAHDYGLRVIFKDSDLKVTKTEVKYLSESAAIVHARMRLNGQSPVEDDEKPEMRFNIFTFVVHKTENGWSCAAAQNTDFVPGKETNKVIDGVLKPAD